jgi:hypothetical protein
MRIGSLPVYRYQNHRLRWLAIPRTVVSSTSERRSSLCALLVVTATWNLFQHEKGTGTWNLFQHEKGIHIVHKHRELLLEPYSIHSSFVSCRFDFRDNLGLE